jgi:Bacteriophage HK97-gp10, putative tail-component
MDIKAFAKWDGLAQLEQRLTSYDDAVHKGIVATVGPHVEAVANKARSMAPVLTGRLRGAIKTKTSKAGHYGKVIVDVSEAPYAVPVIFGGVNNSPNPFPYQARDALNNQFRSTLEQNIKAAVRK